MLVSVCFRYLGYVLYNVHEAGTGPIWLDDVQCKGSETSIDECPHDPWGYSDCNHDDDVSIACYEKVITEAQTQTGIGRGLLSISRS